MRDRNSREERGQGEGEIERGKRDDQANSISGENPVPGTERRDGKKEKMENERRG